jgi:cell division protein ZipA
MEDNFRNVLIVLSAIAITAIFIHGVWTIRKQKNPYKLKASKEKTDPITRDFDRKGFDQDGVGQVKIKPSKQSEKDNIENMAVAEHVLNEGIQLPNDLSKSQILIKKDVLGSLAGHTKEDRSESLDNSSTQALDNSLEDDWFKEETKQDNNVQTSKDALGDSLTTVNQSVNKKAKKSPPKVHIEPLYEQPVTQAKPPRAPINKTNNSSVKNNVKRDQIEIDFDNQDSENVPDKALAPEKAVEPEKPSTQLEPQVIILSVVMPANQQIFGAALLPSLLTLGLKYGEMNIFHRHEDNAGNGKVTFSLANIMNPGSFDLDTMETFATRGVSLFMTLPNAGDCFSVFEQMLNAAKQLAQEFNAQVLDDKRNVLTKQTEQHYLSKIREYDRKSRIGHME